MSRAITNHSHLISKLFQALEKGIPQVFENDGRVRYTIPAAVDIDPERFNRATVNFNGMDVTISIFVPGEFTIEKEGD